MNEPVEEKREWQPRTQPRRIEKLGALYWRRLRARDAGEDFFIVAREIIAEVMGDFDARILDEGTLGADLVRRFCAERNMTMTEFFRINGGHPASYMKDGKTPPLLLASKIELFTAGMVPMESWLIGGGSIQSEKTKATRRAHARQLRAGKRAAVDKYLRVRHHLLLSLKRMTKELVPEEYKTVKLPRYKALKDYAIAKGWWKNVTARFIERVAPSDTQAEDYRVLCRPGTNTPIPPGDYDATLERFSLEQAERNRTRLEARGRGVKDRIAAACGRARQDGEAAGGAGPAGP